MQIVECYNFTIISIARRWREARHKGGKLTEIKEEKIQGVLRSIVPARNEKIRTNLCGRVR